MADFVAVLRRAVENLKDNNSEDERIALYGKAKAALLSQLRALEPPPSDDELQRQSDALDEAIATVEAEYAHPAYASPREPEPAPRPEPEIPDSPPEPGPDVPGPAPEPEPELPEPPPLPGPEIPMPPPGPGPEIPAPSPEQTGHSHAHQSFRSAIAETAALGTASSTAARSARAALGGTDEDDFKPDGDVDDEAERHVPASREFRPAAVGAAAAPDAASASDQVEDGYGGDYERDVDEGGGRGGRLAFWLIVLLVVGGLAGAAYWQRDTVSDMVAAFTGGSQVAEDPDEAKIADRVPAPGAEPTEPTTPPAADAPPTEPGATPAAPAEAPATIPEGTRTAQALLTEEVDPGSGATHSLGGNVEWALLEDPEGMGGPEMVIRGTVRVPDKNIALALAIRRNADAELPASHTIEILFDLPPNFENTGIKGVPGIIMKATPQSQGQPLIGAVVPVTDNFYLVGLSETEFDRDRNINEMKRRNFIDIPLVYQDDSRAVLSLAKGDSGNRVFSEAFAAWGQ